MPSSESIRTVNIPPLAIVVSRYNASVTDALLRGAIEAFTQAGGSRSRLEIVQVPGAYELPVVARSLALAGRVRGVVVLGCVIEGETIHDEVISHAVASALLQISVNTGVPITLGVVNARTAAQAKARAGGKLGNRGTDAMLALLEVVALLSPSSKSTGGAIRHAPDKVARRGLPRKGPPRGRGNHPEDRR
jgi:6,7-dimethyl-8-ribityllumazine synthase